MAQGNLSPTPDYELRIRASFERQQVMQLLNARLGDVLPGEVHIELPFNPKITQQNGYIHAGIITTIVDSACGYAAYSLMPPDNSVLSVEFKMNFIHPAKGGNYSLDKWWTREDDMVMVSSEWIKLFLYAFQGKI